MDTASIYNRLEYCNIGDFHQMLADLRELEAHIGNEYALSKGKRAYGLAQVGNAVAMACRALELAIAANGSDPWCNVAERWEWCEQLVQVISDAVFIHEDAIDSKVAA